ncbi:NAD(P)-binding protein [Wallemia mellicola CBS 633.66]|uniref:NAD(P)-binding protein n=2 Tax=Wallemia mellicola TaxID=1708541 RepID=I4YEW6_WALMC|nr:NAD(P)-binding protein [Wallemia mellicola CBS 633.66]EIM22508.1 NAD(P)-binding protein [Wallemia mellicola CBS 633.66]TIC26229.1 NAD(P)-binding protein [Wallemia mellicola]TIC51751.1 NAD(P)-binding protein [Wallemia mellicola]TIC63709.1 NAD(P)-binding protein [Wallemia mellicola]|eukprot:XP_006957181.1 NAD(P)-binding protein [Wallemia mellicola CBS 633.66]
MPQQLNFGVLGLGRMGIRHALNVVKEPRANLLAVAARSKGTLDSAREVLPASVEFHNNEDEVINHPEVQAILVSTDTSQHARLSLKVIEAGKHLLVEKPISVDLEDSKSVVDAANKHKELKVMVAFVRRFDESYREAYNRIKDGELGDVYYVHGATNDMYDPEAAKFFKEFSKANGSILVDCGVHDADLIRWYIGNEKVKKVTATGYNALIHDLAESQDADNAVGNIQFESGKMATLYLSRTARHGHSCSLNIIGGEGSFVINSDDAQNRLRLFNQTGLNVKSHKTYYDRFKEAFANELSEFTEAILENKELPITVDDAHEAAKMVVGLQMAFRSGKQVFFDDAGYPIKP